MAAAVSSVWAKPGAWALEAEEHEAELQQQAPPSTHNSSSSDFPSLSAAATTKSKKKKGQTLSLAEFSTYSSVKAAPAERLTQAELVSLPTGPRERSAEELDRSRGFRSYARDESSNSRWGSSRVSEDGDRRGRDRDSGPSRADETDNWAASKKPNGFERRERGGGGFFESQSKADEVDSWVSTKPSEPRRFVSSGDRRGSFESLSRNRDSQFSGGSDSDSWGRRREETAAAPPASGVSRPRLVLQPRTLPVAVVEVKPESPVAVATPVEKPRGANPFGNARPREEVLAEKGQDWKEIEEKLEAVKLKEVADERSPGRMGFGLSNGRKDDRTQGSWRKSTEQSEERAQHEEPAVEEANKEDPSKEEPSKEEANKEEANKEAAILEEANKEAAILEEANKEASNEEEAENKN